MTRLEKRLREELGTALNLIFGVFARPDEKHGKMIERMVAASQLSETTVLRLYYGYTQWPRFQTIQKLAHAAGLEVAVGEDASIRLALSAAESKRKRACLA